MDGTDERREADLIRDGNALRLLDELLQVESGLTAWEMDFLESLDRQRGRVFSEKQCNRLGEIGEKLGLGGL